MLFLRGDSWEGLGGKGAGWNVWRAHWGRAVPGETILGAMSSLSPANPKSLDGQVVLSQSLWAFLTVIAYQQYVKAELK